MRESTSDGRGRRQGAVTPPLTCLVFAIDSGGRRVLLGHKLRGLGQGNIVGLGGHVEAGESSREAAAREAFEEAGLAIDPAELDYRGHLQWRFPFKPRWDMDVDVFVADRWSGTPAASEEITPAWHPIDDLPLDAMWDDARHWLPDALAGRPIDMIISYAQDNRSVARLNRLAPA